jgi:hypothetical protein
MSPADKWVAAVGFLSSIGAAVFWLWASVIPVPNNQDTFIAVLQRISGISAIALCARPWLRFARHTFSSNRAGVEGEGEIDGRWKT